MKKLSSLLAMVILVFLPATIFAQQVFSFNLSELQRKGQLITSKRTITVEKDGQKEYIKFGGGLDGSAVFLPVKDFGSGKIEIVARGKDIFQGSFIGVAFHAINDSVYDGVYCRPFNFRTTDSLRRIHMIQYTFSPKYHWQYLRANFNGIYEKGIANPPEADEWFKMTLVINERTVKAYINNADTPSLVVDKLSTNTIGKLGLWGTNCDMESIRIEYLNK